MAATKASIAELSRLVEQIGRFCQQHGEGLSALAAQGDPFAQNQGGRPLREWLAEFWPASGDWWGPAFSLTDAQTLKTSRSDDVSRLENGVARLKREISLMSRESLASRESAFQAEEKARDLLKKAEAAATRLKRQHGGLSQKSAACHQEARDLSRWLDSLVAESSTGFFDRQGRQLKPREVNNAAARLQQLKATLARAQEEAQQCRAAHAAALEDRAKAREELKRARLARLNIQHKAELTGMHLRSAGADLENQLGRLAAARRRLAAAGDFQKAAARLLQIAEPALAAAEKQDRPDPRRMFNQRLAAAREAGRRADRLAYLLENLAPRLGRLSARARELARTAAEINKQIARDEAALPGIIKPLVQVKVGRVRASYGAELSTCLARLEDLREKAQQTRQKLEEATPRLEQALGHADRWSNELLAALAEEREALGAAGQLVDRLEQAGRLTAERGERVAGQAGPLIATLAPLRPLDLAPALGGLVSHLLALQADSRDICQRARELADFTPKPTRAAIPEQLADLSGHRRALQLARGSTLEEERLGYLVKAALHWQSMVAGPLNKAIRAPVEEVAASLSGSISRLAAERQVLLNQRDAAAGAIRRLRQSVALEREVAANAVHHLEKVRQRNRRQHHHIRDLQDQFATARLAHMADQEEMARLKSAGDAQAAGQIARRDKVITALRGKALERHRLYRQANRELIAARQEADRWAALAGRLEASAQAPGQTTEQWVADLAHEADQLKQQVAFLSQLLILANLSGGRVAGVRLTPMSPEDMDGAVKRLVGLRRRLAEMGRSTLGQVALVGGLAGSLILAPQSPSKATRTEAPHVIAKNAVEYRISQDVASARLMEMNASGLTLPGSGARARLELNLLPLRESDAPLPPKVRKRIAALAKEAGLSPQVLLTSARAVLGNRAAVETKAVKALAEDAKLLARRHPVIFKELSKKGLPPSAPKLAGLSAEPEKAQHLFMDRLYREYRSLGFSPEESLGALTANDRALSGMDKRWPVPSRFKGQVQPLPKLEKLTLEQFLKKITPYIQDKCTSYLKVKNIKFDGDLDRYAKDLAFDMYCAAKKFKVPLTFLLAIAHQETWYANVLGDDDLSASPFQIYAPTKAIIVNSLKRAGFVPPSKRVALQHHLTMATFMASYHLRELMEESRGGRTVDMDKVMKRYNGSSLYAGNVAKRRDELAYFLKKG